VIGFLNFMCPHKALSVLTEDTGYVETKDYLLVRDFVHNLCVYNLLSSAACCCGNRNSRNRYNVRLDIIVFSYVC
jgi:hypothetical protein